MINSMDLGLCSRPLWTYFAMQSTPRYSLRRTQRGAMSATMFAQRLPLAAAVCAFIGALSVAALLLCLWFEHRAPLELPRPSGPFAVGRLTFHWTQHTRLDELAPSPGSARELLVWIWYPSDRATGNNTDYLPPQWRAALARSSSILMTHFLTRDLARVRAHSYENAGLSAGQRTYPVVVLRAGSGALVTTYSSLAEDLASH